MRPHCSSITSPSIMLAALAGLRQLLPPMPAAAGLAVLVAGGGIAYFVAAAGLGTVPRQLLRR